MEVHRIKHCSHLAILIHLHGLDASGKVRVWSWDNPEHMTKLETPVFNGEIKDLDWDSESKKIVAVGDGSHMVCNINCRLSYTYLFSLVGKSIHLGHWQQRW